MFTNIKLQFKIKVTEYCSTLGGFMMNMEYILFDLDGTLTDPKEGITKSIAYALERMGAKSLEEPILESFIGPPLKEAFCQICGFNNKEAEEAVHYYRERFQKIGLYENQVYPGIEEILSSLKEKGAKLAVATSKPTIFADRIVSHFHLKPYFDLVMGSNLDGSRSAKNEVIHDALERLSVPSTKNVVMIGDRKFDIIGARKESVPCIAVNYGYGSQEELLSANPMHIVQSVQELREYLMSTL